MRICAADVHGAAGQGFIEDGGWPGGTGPGVLEDSGGGVGDHALEEGELGVVAGEELWMGGVDGGQDGEGVGEGGDGGGEGGGGGGEVCEGEDCAGVAVREGEGAGAVGEEFEEGGIIEGWVVGELGAVEGVGLVD